MCVREVGVVQGCDGGIKQIRLPLYPVPHLWAILTRNAYVYLYSKYRHRFELLQILSFILISLCLSKCLIDEVKNRGWY